MRRESSKMIDAISRFCEIHADDPNLFPQKQDNAKIYSNTVGSIISEHPECSSSELSVINNQKLRQELEGQKDIINA